MAKLDNSPARGTRDLLPAAVARREAVQQAIAESYARFGFRRIETPSIEAVERLTGGQGGENEKLIFKILRRGLEEDQVATAPISELADLALRFDLTVPLTRFYANNHALLPSPFRALQIGHVWRAERPAKGRYRQFTQCDIDTLGESSVLAECELLEATATTLVSLGIAPITVRVNDRRLLGAIAEHAGVGEEARGGYFVALDKLDKIGWEGVAAELGGRGFAPEVAARTEAVVTALCEATTPDALLDRAADLLASVEKSVLEELAESARLLAALGRSDKRIGCSLDPTIVRGMGYYTGQIFEVAHPSSASSIAGGGRYDDLVGRSLGRPVPACGISIGFDRVVDLAELLPHGLGTAVLYGDEPIERVLETARQLRATGERVTLVPRRKAMRQQLDALAADGFDAFVTFADGVAGPPRPLRGDPT